MTCFAKMDTNSPGKAWCVDAVAGFCQPGGRGVLLQTVGGPAGFARHVGPEARALGYTDRGHIVVAEIDPTTYAALIKAARAAAGAHLLEFPEDARFVLLGARVAAAFGLDYSPFTVNVRGGLAPDAGHQRFLVLPHPSGRCHAWNYPDSAPRARAALAELRSA